MTDARDRADAAIREAAAEWLVRLDADDAGEVERAAFATWLRASPAHVREYLRAEAAWFALRDATQGDGTDVDTLLRQTDDNVVALAPVGDGGIEEPAGRAIDSRSGPKSRERSWHRRLFATAAGLALLAAGGLALWTLLPRQDIDVRTTGIGEMRRIVLADGSAIELNTRSQVSIAFGAQSRDVHLDQGEAFFSVAKDPRRPFRVFSGDTLVRAVGTEFNVYRQPGGDVAVTVVEGRVAVLPAAAASLAGKRDDGGARIEVGAGQGLRVPAGNLRVARAFKVDSQHALAWRQRRLVFDDQPLAAIVDEFNRYNREQLVVRDPTLAARRLSGVFDPDKPESLLAFLARDGAATRTLADGRLLIVADATTLTNPGDEKPR